jgi:hypothetical protein
MKDQHDKHTVDGFADLLLPDPDEQPAEPAPEPRPGVALSDLAKLLDHVAEQHGIVRKRPVGRPPKGSKALTPGEKQKAYRDRKRAEKQAQEARLEAIKNGEPVTSSIIDLTTDFVTAYRTVRDRS